jgi:hypothetical protein
MIDWGFISEAHRISRKKRCERPLNSNRLLIYLTITYTVLEKCSR